MRTETKSALHYLRMAFISLALGLAVAVPVYYAAAALGVRFGIWDWRFGLGQLTMAWGPRITLTAAGSAVLALIFVFLIRPRGRGLLAALLSLAIIGAVLYQGYQVRQTAESLPPINDITTDPQNPPEFAQALIALRSASGAETPLEYAAKEIAWNGETRSFADWQAEAYPGVQPIMTGESALRAFDAAMRSAQSLGWVVQYADRDAGRLNATDSSFWYGFTDDIAIRITPTGETGAIIDIRSVSRVGVSDLGANAERIQAFRAAVLRRLD